MERNRLFFGLFALAAPTRRIVPIWRFLRRGNPDRGSIRGL